MGALFSRMTTHVRRPAAAILLIGAIAWPIAPASARGPENIADVAEQVIDAVVNISTKQSVDVSSNELPDLPPDASPEDLLNQLLKPRGKKGQKPPPHRVTSLGSGFIIDSAGYIVTNN